MTWDEFTRALTRTLRALTDRCYLIVSAPGGGYVQFARTATELHAEAAGSSFLDAGAVVPGGDELLAAAGWQPPGTDVPNWDDDLALPAMSDELAAVARRCVVALRDVFAAPDPMALTYRAWREADVQPSGETWTDEQVAALDRGENPLLLPMLGLRHEA